MSLRQDLVNQGEAFLDNREIGNADLSSKIKFLEGKGLTTNEILTALGRVSGRDAGTSSNFSGGWFWDSFIPGALVVGAGVAMYLLSGETEVSADWIPSTFLGDEGNIRTSVGADAMGAGTEPSTSVGPLRTEGEQQGSQAVEQQSYIPQLRTREHTGAPRAKETKFPAHVASESDLDGTLAALLEQQRELSRDVHDLGLQLQMLLNPTDEGFSSSIGGNHSELTQLRTMVEEVRLGMDELRGKAKESSEPTGGGASVDSSASGEVNSTETEAQTLHPEEAALRSPSTAERIDSAIDSTLAFVKTNMGGCDSPDGRKRIRGACQSLLMYVEKVAEAVAVDAGGGSSTSKDALLARYRKINTNNQVFVRTVRSVVENYEPILKCAGFVQRLGRDRQLMGYEFEWVGKAFTANRPPPEEVKRILQATRQCLAVVLGYCERDTYDAHHDSSEQMTRFNRVVFEMMRPGDDCLPKADEESS